ncbi:MAG: deoxyribose-phosphate aldolase, partial [candidate division WOR-3 bacterium]
YNNYVMEIRKYIEATLLRPEKTWKEYKEFIEKSIEIGVFGVCVPPTRVIQAKEILKNTNLKLISVCDFPFGYGNSDIKKRETEKLIEKGCDEVDMVMNIQKFKDGNYEDVRKEIEEVVKVASGKPIKVIIECGLLTPEEISLATKIVCESGANFVKTSTGFLSRGVKLSDIRIIKKSLKNDVRIKASGGIRTYGFAKILIEMGVERIGTSDPFNIIKEGKE